MTDPRARTSRRAALTIAAWAVPTTIVTIVTPAFAVSSPDQPEHAGLNHNGSVRQDSIQANPRAWAWGDPGRFDPAANHRIQVSIAITGVAAIAGHNICLVDPRSGNPSGATRLNGWEVLSSSASKVVLQWPHAVSGSDFNTSNFEWYFLEFNSAGVAIPDEPQAGPGSVRVVGNISGSAVSTFDGGDIVGP